MYTERPWTLRQYAGFANAAESNSFYKRALAQGQRGLSVAFDLPTHRGYDSDHPDVGGDVGMAGVAISSVEDMKALFDGIPLDQVSVSMTMSGAVLPVLASYIVAAEETGVHQAALQGTLQNDILKEFLVRNTYIFGPAPSLRIVGDIIAYCSQHLPKFNPISISGYHVQEAGANPPLELGITLANGLTYVETARRAGLEVDAFAPRLSFFFGVGMDFLLEIAKLRAARVLWASAMRERYAVRDPNSLRLRMHCQTSGVSLTAQEPLNNVVRTTVEAMAAVLGGTQSLHTNGYDEAWALPSDDAARLARNTQLILQHETDLCATIDPFGGSYAMEALTAQLVEQARQFITQVEAGGGMLAALENGWVQQRIVECATVRQARLDRGLDKQVGVNFQRSVDETTPVLRTIDNGAVLSMMRAQLAALRQRRDAVLVEETLDAVQGCAADERAPAGELLRSCIDAMRARATVGELTARLERVWPRYVPASRGVTGVYTREYANDESWSVLAARTRAFEVKTGRRPRLLVAKLGQDGHDRGAKVIASGFADAGFDVDLGPLFQTPEQVARVALDNDVHVVGISTQTAGHRTLVPQLCRALAAEGATDVLIVVGGIVPAADRDPLFEAGVALIFSPGTPIIRCVEQVLDALDARPA
jgi:methylmalonyl-CoA mutase